MSLQDPNDADNGWEVDNNEDNFDAVPLTQPRVYNVSMIGKGPGGKGGTDGESTRGILLRRGVGGFYRNILVQGYGRSCLDIDNQETVNRIGTGDLEFTHSMLYDCANIYDTDGDFDLEAIFENPEWSNRVNVDPGVNDPYNPTAPDWTLAVDAAARTGAATPPNDGFFDTSATYVGGAADTPWWAGWTAYPQN